ncbi:MAG: hypothetical protein II305_06775 [Clostridia bacterium]|nr:hypothetical protein [Clostridia bacterium]
MDKKFLSKLFLVLGLLMTICPLYARSHYGAIYIGLAMIILSSAILLADFIKQRKNKKKRS